MHGGTSFGIAEIGAEAEHDLHPLLDVEPLHAPETPCLLSFFVPELLPPGGEAISGFVDEGKVVTEDRNQSLTGVVDLLGDPPDLFESAL